jgi:HAD superfamily hydrolase (TIGR01509 family)
MLLPTGEFVTLRLTDVETAIFDVDGTLIDSNRAHAETWAEAFRAHGIDVDAEAIRPLIGMGGDKLLPKAANIEADSELGKAIAQRKKELFAEQLPNLSPTRGARPLVEFLCASNIELAVATSADEEEVRALLKTAGVDDLFPIRSSKDDADKSKPDPDVVHAAMQRLHAPPNTTVMIGDTPYDVEAGRRAGVTSIALRCGGYWSDADLQGASMILDDPAELLKHFRGGR